MNKNNIDLFLAFAALIVVVYRVFQIEAAIYDAIEDLRKASDEKINILERNFALHVAIYLERKERVDYLLHALDEKIDHKYNRLFQEIKELEAEHKCKTRKQKEE